MNRLKDNLPKHVSIVEVGPRDGLQDEEAIIDTKTKVEFINRLSATGLKRIEVTSFVRADRIPQLADAELLMSSIQRNPEIEYTALVPNEKELQRALATSLSSFAVFTSATDSFSRHNINCDVERSLQNFVPVFEFARQHGYRVRGYISCCWGCPYEGHVEPSQVLYVARRLQELGCHEIVLADTIGVATPVAVQELIRYLGEFISIDKLTLHLHDSRGQALANVLAALQSGIRTFDSSVAGLGGCPYAPGAGGNLGTEDLLYMLHGMGINTGIDLQAIIETGRFISQFIERNHSRTGRAGSFAP